MPSNADTDGSLVFALNGKVKGISGKDVDPSMTLLDYLRNVEGLKGTKYGCGEGGCGTCAVTLSRWENGKETFKSVNSCLAPLASAHGWAITTVEGLRAKALSKKDTKDAESFHPIQKRLANLNGVQCGYCSPGMVMTMYQALKKNPNATMAELEEQFDGNICRCTGFRPILDTAKSFASDSNTVDHVCKKSYTKGCYDQKKWDQDFPEELKNFKATKRITFRKNGLTWIKPKNSLDDLLDVIKENPNGRLTVGKTSVGIYKPSYNVHESETKGWKPHPWHLDASDPTTFIDIADVKELNSISEASVGNAKGLAVGAAVRISHVMKALKASAGSSVSFLPLVDHMKKVANVHVRDAGSIAGNLMLAKTKGFLSDLATILLGAGATVTWAGRGLDSKSATQTMEEFLATPEPPKDAVLLSIHIPYLSKNVKFKTYRNAIRPKNAHAITNAAFRVTVDGSGKMSGAVLAIGGLMEHGSAGDHALRLTKIESMLNGQTLTNDIFVKARSAIRAAAEDIVKKAGGLRAAARIACTEAFFVRFCLSIADNIEPELASGTDTVDKILYATTTAKQNFNYSDEHAPVSLPIPLQSGKMLAAGSAKFNCDTKPLTGTVFGAIVGARRPRAIIKKIDWSAALKATGVIGYVSKEDVGEASYSPMGEPYPIPHSLYAKTLFAYGAGDSVPYNGAPIGMIIAKTEAQARDAVRLVVTEYVSGEKPITAIDSTVAQQIVPGLPFLPTEFKHATGDTKKAMESAKTAEGISTVGQQKHFYMDPQFAYAIPDEESGMKILMSTQWPQGANVTIAALLKLPMSNVDIRHGRMGGAFGGKNIPVIAGLVAMGAKKYELPVYLHCDRNADMRMIAGRPKCEAKYKVAFGSDGKLNALDFQHKLSSGSSVSLGWFTNMSVGSAITQSYLVPNRNITCNMILTNEPPVNVMRGPGEIQASCHIETILEHVAHSLGMDPHEVRRANLLPNDEKVLKDNGFTDLDNYTGLKMWEALEKRCCYRARAEKVKVFNKDNKLRKKGICMIPVRYKVNIWKRTALVNLYTDGTVCVTHGGINMGQGMHVKVAQVVSYELGKLLGEPVPLENIKFNKMSSRILSAQIFTGGSTGSEGACEAARRACEALVKRMSPILAGLEEKAKAESKAKAAEEKKDGGDGAIETPRISFAQVCAGAEGANIQMTALGHWSDTKDNDKATYNCWGVGCSEIELDVLTGEMVLLRTDLEYDSAKSLNPAIDIGQCEGAYMQGVGMMLQEEVLMDDNSGELIADGTWEYKPPLALNIPKEWNVNFYSGEHKGRVLSSKASGEPPLILAASVFFALRHAIADARADVGLTDFFKLSVPATVTDRMALLAPVVQNLKSLSKPFK